MRLFAGTIPGAVVFGAAFDGACSIWRVDTCTGKRMACERYDNATILYSLLAIALVVKTIQVSLFARQSYNSYAITNR